MNFKIFLKKLIKTLVGIVYRAGLTEFKINLPNNKNKTLTVIVENMGRLNFGNNLLDTKVMATNTGHPNYRLFC